MCANVSISPQDLRFMHKSISPDFHGTYTFPALAEKVMKARGVPSDVEPLQIVRRDVDGKYYVFKGNRRLWLYQWLQKRGYITSVQAMVLTGQDHFKDSYRFNTNNNGTSITFHGDRLGEVREMTDKLDELHRIYQNRR